MSQITTHILDTASGFPAAGVPLSLSAWEPASGEWQTLAQGETNDDGRLPAMLPDGQVLPAGRYCMRFETEEYLKQRHGNCFYPFVEVVFEIPGDGDHHHIPLLLAPFGYSTYRGS